MYWDATDDPRDVDQHPISRHNPPGCRGPNSTLWPYWEPWIEEKPKDQVTRWWALHEVSLMFWSTWRECLALAQTSYGLGRMVWDPLWVRGRLVPPYWKAHTTGAVFFCWWSSAEAEAAAIPFNPKEHRRQSIQMVESIHRTWSDRIRAHNFFGNCFKDVDLSSQDDTGFTS